MSNPWKVSRSTIDQVWKLFAYHLIDGATYSIDGGQSGRGQDQLVQLRGVIEHLVAFGLYFLEAYSREFYDIMQKEYIQVFSFHAQAWNIRLHQERTLSQRVHYDSGVLRSCSHLQSGIPCDLWGNMLVG